MTNKIQPAKCDCKGEWIGDQYHGTICGKHVAEIGNNMKPDSKAACHHVIFMNESGIRCAWCDLEVTPVKIKYPRLAWLWMNYWCLKQKVKSWLNNQQ